MYETDFDHIDVANAALTLVRANPIRAFDDEDERSAAVNAVYWITIDALLTSARWHFVQQFSTLNLVDADAAVDRRGWEHGHALPADRIGPPSRLFTDRERKTPLVAYELTDRHILSDEATVYGIIPRRGNPLNWPGYFRFLAVRVVACEMAVTIRGDEGMRNTLYQECYGTPREQGLGGLFKKATDQDHAARAPEDLGAAGDTLLAGRDIAVEPLCYRF